MGNWKRLDNQRVQPLWLERANEKYGTADWSTWFGGLMYPSDRQPVIQWLESDTGAGLLLGQGSDPESPRQSLVVLYAPPQSGLWAMPLYGAHWYPQESMNKHGGSYEQAFESVMGQVIEFLTIEARFLDMFYPSADLDHFYGISSGPYV